MEIPKIIHYCWFGHNPKPQIVEVCIASWQKYMPEFEIKEWNESNYDCGKCNFVREAYSVQKWAYVSDYARFDILNQYGGIYFDTDVELLKPIPPEIMKQSAFTGMESAGKVNPGLVFASIQQHPFLQEILQAYEHTHFLINGRPCYKTVNMFTTEILSQYGFVEKNYFQRIMDIGIYPAEMFCGYDQDIHEVDIRPETISVHHYASSWITPEQQKKYIYQDVIKKLFGRQVYRKLLWLKRKIGGV